jgi:hypothetical protein
MEPCGDRSRARSEFTERRLNVRGVDSKRLWVLRGDLENLLQKARAALGAATGTRHQMLELASISAVSPELSQRGGRRRCQPSEQLDVLAREPLDLLPLKEVLRVE